MITNERQYRITKAQADNFERALTCMSDAPEPDSDIHPLLWEAQKNGIRSQLGDLQAELREYETLKSGKRRAWVLQSVEQLPEALIQARIVAGMSQKELAEQLNLKEQQFQRYEASNYSGASWTRLCEVMRVLGVSLQGEFTVAAPASTDAFIKRLAAAGVDKDLLFGRILPPQIAHRMKATGGSSSGRISSTLDWLSDAPPDTADTLREASSWVSRVFRLTENDLLTSVSALELDMTVAGATRFKVKRRSNIQRTTAYTLYAHYLSLLVLQATAHVPRQPLPLSDREVWQAVAKGWGEVNFSNVLAYIWSLGIPVLPLEGSGGFHGACWRSSGRNVIVLKQKTTSVAAWLHDLLHELWHALQEPENDELSVIEDEPTSEERLTSPEEQMANDFAGIIELNGQAKALTQLCIQKSGGNIPALKQAVRQVAAEHNAPVDRLANYLAYRISAEPSLRGESWWATAATFQVHGEPWKETRDVLWSQLDWNVLTSFDRELLQRALEPLPAEG